MALVKCEECGAEVSNTANACIKCGAPFGNPAKAIPASNLKKKVGFTDILGAIVVVVVGLWWATHKDADPEPVDVQASAPGVSALPPGARAVPALDVASTKLFSDYQSNEIAADGVYKGKAIRVTGIVISINKDFADDAYVSLLGANEYETVQANLKGSETRQAAALHRGQASTLNCIGGGMVVSSPILNGCVFN